MKSKSFLFFSLLVIIILTSSCGLHKKEISETNPTIGLTVRSYKAYDFSPVTSRIFGKRIIALGKNSQKGDILILHDIPSKINTVVAQGDSYYFADLNKDFVIYTVMNPTVFSNSLYLYDIKNNSTQLIATNVSPMQDIRINKDHIVYTDTSLNYMAYHIPGKTKFLINYRKPRYFHAISGKTVAYDIMSPSGQAKIKMTLDITKGKWQKFTSTPAPYGYWSIEMDKNYTLWTEDFGGAGKNKIKILDNLTLNSVKRIVTINPNPHEFIGYADIHVQKNVISPGLPSSSLFDGDQVRVVYESNNKALKLPYRIKLYENGITKVIKRSNKANKVSTPQIAKDYIIWHYRKGPKLKDPWGISLYDIATKSEKIIF